MRWGELALVATVAALLAGMAPPGPAAAAEPQRTLSTGPLEAIVEPDPFRLTFRDTTSGEVLRTLSGGTPTPYDPSARYGSLGYSFDLRIPIVNNAFLGYYVALNVETLWFHATRVLGSTQEGADLVLDLATNDPLGHRLAVRLSPTAEGGITVDSRIAPGSGPLATLAGVSGTGFEAGLGERFLGFGERSNAADQTGNLVFNWSEEGPFSSGSAEDIFRPLLPEFTFPTGPTASNFPIPWTISTRGFGVLIDQTQRSYFRLMRERQDAWHAEAEANFFRFTVFGGPEPADVLSRYSDYAGRQPDPAPWIFGPWFQPTLESRPYELAERFRNEDVPVTVAQTYTHYLPCGAHVGNGAGQRAQTAAYHRLGYKITTYFNPHICTDYSPVYGQAAAAGHLVKNALGQPYVVSNPFTADEQVSEVDFTNPGADAFYHGLLDEAIEDGYDGWMEDFGEYTPTDSVFADGRRGLEMHNRYPVLYHCASYDHTRERFGRDAAVFVRSGWHGVQPCARVVWGGDPTEDWSCSDGLCAAVHQALSTGLSGVAYWGSDIGGFHAVVNPRTSNELNIRWLELGAVSGVMRTQANGFSLSNNRASRSQVWNPAVYPIWRRFTKLRTQLLPYIAAASEIYQQTGMPLSRHLALVYPDDPEAILRQDEFMFGPELLAAPVVEEGALERNLYLPGGDWIDFWQAVGFDQASGDFSIAAPPALIPGGRELTVAAPLDQLPLMVRAGAILPLLPSDVDTLAPEGEDPGIVNLGERSGTVELLTFPRGSSQTTLAGGETIISSETARGWELRIDGSPGHLYRVEASLGTLAAPFQPCRVTLDGRVMSPSEWTYDPATGVLRTAFVTRDAQLSASRSCDQGQQLAAPTAAKIKKKKSKKKRKKKRTKRKKKRKPR